MDNGVKQPSGHNSPGPLGSFPNSKGHDSSKIQATKSEIGVYQPRVSMLYLALYHVSQFCNIATLKMWIIAAENITLIIKLRYYTTRKYPEWQLIARSLSKVVQAIGIKRHILKWFKIEKNMRQRTKCQLIMYTLPQTSAILKTVLSTISQPRIIRF